MTISAGSRFGSYEVVAQIGAGGMGEVYQARDSKLGREVAIKVLPEAFAHDAERLSRFQREAKLLAALNHPNIATIHGLEQSNGTHYLVMELVAGETLADRIRSEGLLAIEEALPIAKQIAEALEAAHEKGIIHRDLKPANVKVTPEGKVKVLDFGLAKAFAGDGASEDIANSPTLSAMATVQGVILGTAAYMSPEQARGKSVDKRTDIFAFGAVLYEMLTGRRAFEGEDISMTLAAVMKSEPDWERLPSDLPTALHTVLRRCLQKDPKQRFQAIGDVRLAMEGAFETPVAPSAGTMAASPHAGWRSALSASLVTLIAGGAIIGLTTWALMRPLAPRPSRWLITPSGGESLVSQTGTDLAISPDGTRIVYLAERNGTRQLYLRQIDQVEAQAIPGTDGAFQPFFSPDGESVAFGVPSERTLKKVSLQGGPAVTICDVPDLRNGSWGADGTIVFASGATGGGLYRVSAAGGKPELLASPDPKQGERWYRWPEILPGGRAVVFTTLTTGSVDQAQVAVLSLQTGKRKVLVQGGSDPHYASSGHLVYGRSGTLMAVPFDLASLKITGAPVPIQEGVYSKAGGAADFAVSQNGSLIYEGLQAIQSTLLWVDRKGAEQPVPGPPRAYFFPQLSANGQRVAVAIQEGGELQIWLYDLRRDSLTRWTFAGAYNLMGAWTPDGQRIAFESDKEGPLNLFWQRADGSGGLERLSTSEYSQYPRSWSPDGQALAFTQISAAGNTGIWILRIADRKAQPFLQTAFNELAPIFSPDGHWIAYDSDESGRDEIYVRPYPGPGGEYQISTDGGTEPVWNPKGGELFYRNGDKMMAVEVATRPTFSAGKPKMLFEGSYLLSRGAVADYDISKDGQRFLMLKSSNQEQGATSPINVVLNWTEELKRRVPAGR
jgi:eukaryotic-like serine/threonine-protein kinase